jgi:hypothetical protein
LRRRSSTSRCPGVPEASFWQHEFARSEQAPRSELSPQGWTLSLWVNLPPGVNFVPMSELSPRPRGELCPLGECPTLHSPQEGHS